MICIGSQYNYTSIKYNDNAICNLNIQLKKVLPGLKFNSRYGVSLFTNKILNVLLKTFFNLKISLHIQDQKPTLFYLNCCVHAYLLNSPKCHNIPEGSCKKYSLPQSSFFIGINFTSLYLI